MLKGVNGSIRILRERYRATWGIDWPEDDTYMREITRDVSSVENALIYMRECHEFTPTT